MPEQTTVQVSAVGVTTVSTLVDGVAIVTATPPGTTQVTTSVDGSVQVNVTSPAGAVVNAEAPSTDINVVAGGDVEVNVAVGAASGGTGITELTGDVAAGPGFGSQVATIANDAVSNVKLANVATQTIKGRTTAGTGDPEDLTATQATSILNEMVGDSGSGVTKGLVPAAATGNGSVHYLRKDGTWAAPPGTGITELTGDVTAGPGSGSQTSTIANDAVTNAKLANMAEKTVKGRGSGLGTGDPSDLSSNDLATILDLATDPPQRTSNEPVKAWVSFDGNTADNVSGTYSRTGTTVTVTVSGHGHIVGHKVYLDFTSGAATDGLFTVVSVIDIDNFTITHGASGSTSGNVTLLRRLIRVGTGFQSIVYRNSAGLYVANIISSLAITASYVIQATCGTIGAANPQLISPNLLADQTAQCFDLMTTNAAPTAVNLDYVFLTIIR